MTFDIDIFFRRDVVEGVVEYIQFNICSTILTTGVFDIISCIVVFTFIFLISIIGSSVYYIHRKYKSIDYHTKMKYSNNDSIDVYDKDNNINTYKDDLKEYKKDIYELDANILPDKHTVINLVDIIKELKQK